MSRFTGPIFNKLSLYGAPCIYCTTVLLFAPSYILRFGLDLDDEFFVTLEFVITDEESFLREISRLSVHEAVAVSVARTLPDGNRVQKWPER